MQEALDQKLSSGPSLAQGLAISEQLSQGPSLDL